MDEAKEEAKAAAKARAAARVESSNLRGSCGLYESLAQAVFVKKLTDPGEIAKEIGWNEVDLRRNLHVLPKEEQEALAEGGLAL